MIDGSFSILNPLFMVYHSYIDYMLELKIRLINEDQEKVGYNSFKEFTDYRFNYIQNNKRLVHNNDLETLLQVFHWQNNLSNFYEYPLIEWIDTKEIVSFDEAKEEGNLFGFTKTFEQNENYQSCSSYG